MSDCNHFSSGPAVGIGDGTLLVEWPCRLVSLNGTSAKFLLMPMAASWYQGKLFVCVVRPDGTVGQHEVTELQFDPGGKK